MATKRTSNTVPGLSKAPNAGKHPAAPATVTAQQPYDVPLPGTETAEPAAREPRRSFDEPVPPTPLAQFNSKIDATLLHRFRRLVKSRDVSIQTATSEAMMMWIRAHDR